MRTGFALGTLFFAAFACAQSPRPMDDLESRQTLLTALNTVNIVDGTNPNWVSYVARVDTTETVGSLTSTSIGVLRYFSDESSTNFLHKAELTAYQGGVLTQRVVADGRRVWAYSPQRNEYSVSAYDTERAPRNADYRKDFLNFLRSPSQSVTSPLLTLAMQSGMTGNVSLKDWIGGLPWQGEENATGTQRTVWQATGNNSRYVRFDLTASATLGWVIQQIRIYKSETVAGLPRVTDSVITFPLDSLGNLMTQTPASPDFVFTPPARARVIASPRNF